MRCRKNPRSPEAPKTSPPLNESAVDRQGVAETGPAREKRVPCSLSRSQYLVCKLSTSCGPQRLGYEWTYVARVSRGRSEQLASAPLQQRFES